ncbi:MAG: class I SAM-dependent methyltransferase [Deltaproteobacteria bacterium]|nr:class I SAM-dependent methyltransferase [Deltaproteobacteria bacterium]
MAEYWRICEKNNPRTQKNSSLPAIDPDARPERDIPVHLTPEKPAQAESKIVSKWNQSDTVYVAGDGFKRYWETLEEVWRYQVMMISGGRCYMEHTFSFFPENKRLSDLTGLIIGCNYGKDTSQTAIARSNLFKELTVVDIAEDLLVRQKALTDELGFGHILNFECLDLNKDHLPQKDGYDFIHAWGTIHHIERLEGLFSEINDALLPDGIFSMREYVGPSCLQFTDQTVSLVNRILSTIPDPFKRDEHGKIKTESWHPTRNEIVSDDPSEAVRSDRILSIAEKNLNVLACSMTGGTLLNPLLHGIAGNFEGTEEALNILKMIILFEQTLIDAGVISSDYVYLIAGKKYDP